MSTQSPHSQQQPFAFDVPPERYSPRLTDAFMAQQRTPPQMNIPCVRVTGTNEPMSSFALPQVMRPDQMSTVARSSPTVGEPVR